MSIKDIDEKIYHLALKIDCYIQNGNYEKAIICDRITRIILEKKKNHEMKRISQKDCTKYVKD